MPKTQIFLPIRDGRDQVKCQPTHGKPTIIRARLGERPRWSVVSFGSAAVADVGLPKIRALYPTFTHCLIVLNLVFNPMTAVPTIDQQEFVESVCF